jgi:hypothetical protein
VIQLARDLNSSFHHVKRSANREADKLAKEEVLKLALIVSVLLLAILGAHAHLCYGDCTHFLGFFPLIFRFLVAHPFAKGF